MVSPYKAGIVAVGLVFLIASLSSAALAVPILVGPGVGVDFTPGFDTPLAFAGSIESSIPVGGSRVATNLLLGGLVNWEVILSLVINDRSPSGLPDIVAVSGRAKHINNMPDNGQHQNADVFEFSATFAGGRQAQGFP
jgi:hypothetical protein